MYDKKATKNISLLIPLLKFVDITQLKNTKKKINCITSVTFYAVKIQSNLFQRPHL